MFKRRISQIISLLVLHSSWGPEVKWLCNPVLSCHSCALAWFACPIGIFVHYSGYHIFPFLALGMVAVVGILVGRLFCGWVCPFGFLMDMLHKIPSPKFDLPSWAGYFKYVVLGVTVIALPYMFGEMTEYSFCRICPASAIQVTLPNAILGGGLSMDVMTVAKLAFLALVVVLAIMSSRSFCKVFCPIAAIMGPFNYIGFWAIRMPKPEACPGCKKCERICPTDVKPFARVREGLAPNRTDDCIVCHECQEGCPKHVSEKKGGGTPAAESPAG